MDGGSVDGIDALQAIFKVLFEGSKEVLKCEMTAAEKKIVTEARDELFLVSFTGAKIIAEDAWDWSDIYKNVNAAVNYWESGYVAYFGEELAIIFKKVI